MSSEEQGQPPPESVVVGNKRNAEDVVDVVSPSAKEAKMNDHIEKGKALFQKCIRELKDRMERDMDMDLELIKMAKEIFIFFKSCTMEFTNEEILKYEKNKMDELREEYISALTMASRTMKEMEKTIEHERMHRRRLTEEVERLKDNAGDSPPPPPTCVVHYNPLIQGFCSP